jgi:hypothetical protein
MLLQPVVARADWLITVLNAVVMGLFGAIGASKALSLGVGEAGASPPGPEPGHSSSSPNSAHRSRSWVWSAWS